MSDERITALAELLRQHRQRPFLAVGDLSTSLAWSWGPLMPMLRPASVSAWLDRGGAIDDQRWDVLAAREQQLIRVLPELVGYEAS